MHVNWEISMGTIIEGISLIVVILGATFRLSGRLDKMETKLDIVFDWYKSIILHGRHQQGD